MVLAFCRRGSVIPICLYLLVGRYMKERINGLRNESSKTKRTGLFQSLSSKKKLIPTKSLCILAHRDRRDYGGLCKPEDLGLFVFLVIKFFVWSEQLSEPNRETHPWLLRNGLALRKERSVLIRRLSPN